MEKSTVYMSPGLKDRLSAVARVEGRTQADVVREALERYLAGKDAPRPRFGVATPKDSDKIDSSNLDEFLAEAWGKDLSGE